MIKGVKEGILPFFKYFSKIIYNFGKHLYDLCSFDIIGLIQCIFKLSQSFLSFCIYSCIFLSLNLFYNIKI